MILSFSFSHCCYLADIFLSLSLTHEYRTHPRKHAVSTLRLSHTCESVITAPLFKQTAVYPLFPLELSMPSFSSHIVDLYILPWAKITNRSELQHSPLLSILCPFTVLGICHRFSLLPYSLDTQGHTVETVGSDFVHNFLSNSSSSYSPLPNP